MVARDATVVKAKISEAYRKFLSNRRENMVPVVATGQAAAIRIVNSTLSFMGRKLKMTSMISGNNQKLYAGDQIEPGIFQRFAETCLCQGDTGDQHGYRRIQVCQVGQGIPQDRGQLKLNAKKDKAYRASEYHGGGEAFFQLL